MSGDTNQLVERKRNELGQFVKGQSGNLAGRPKGSRNEATKLKEFIEHANTEVLAAEAPAIMAKAIQMAKDGDAAMIKLILGDMMKHVRTEEGEKSDNKVTVSIELMKEDVKDIVIENPPQEEL